VDKKYNCRLLGIDRRIWYIYFMIVEQTVEIPSDHRLFINVPPEVPAGKAILTFTPALVNIDLEYAENIWANNRAHAEEFKAKLKELQGCLGKNAFNGLDGVEYQHKVREEWDDP
jgi:hypothetical protein